MFSLICGFQSKMSTVSHKWCRSSLFECLVIYEAYPDVYLCAQSGAGVTTY